MRSPGHTIANLWQSRGEPRRQLSQTISSNSNRVRQTTTLRPNCLQSSEFSSVPGQLLIHAHTPMQVQRTLCPLENRQGEHCVFGIYYTHIMRACLDAQQSNTLEKNLLSDLAGLYEAMQAARRRYLEQYGNSGKLTTPLRADEVVWPLLLASSN